MKAITLLLGAVAINAASFAQTNLSYDPQVTSHQTAMREGVMKLEGKMWYIKELPDSMKLENDMVVYANGNYKTSSGKAYVMQDKDRIDFEGIVQGIDQRIDEDNGMLVMEDGKVWVWTLLNRPIQLQDGNYVMPDGTLRLKAGEYMPVKENTFVDFLGNESVQSW